MSVFTSLNRNFRVIFLCSLLIPLTTEAGRQNKEGNFIPPKILSPISSPKEFFPRGIHLTEWVSGSPQRFQKVIELLKATELNTVVIDLKEIDGGIAFEADVPLAKEIKSISCRIPEIDQVMAVCRQNNIYKIARIAVFKDNILAGKKPHLAVHDESGQLWHDYNGWCWVNPYSKEVWEYNVAIAKEAIKHGFDEIQFDYVRFPSDGRISSCNYGRKHNQTEAVKTIVEFVKFARAKLGTEVILSVDVFGLTTSRTDGLGIGQKIRDIAPWLDYISPMVYPSHYGKGAYGLKNPNTQPYTTVFLALKGACRQVEGTGCKIRPWLQDFSLGHYYGPLEVTAQIKAAYECGIKEWLLWNPACRYTAAALTYSKENEIPNVLPRHNFPPFFPPLTYTCTFKPAGFKRVLFCRKREESPLAFRTLSSQFPFIPTHTGLKSLPWNDLNLHREANDNNTPNTQPHKEIIFACTPHEWLLISSPNKKQRDINDEPTYPVFSGKNYPSPAVHSPMFSGYQRFPKHRV